MNAYCVPHTGDLKRHRQGAHMLRESLRRPGVGVAPSGEAGLWAPPSGPPNPPSLARTLHKPNSQPRGTRIPGLVSYPSIPPCLTAGYVYVRMYIHTYMKSTESQGHVGPRFVCFQLLGKLPQPVSRWQMAKTNLTQQGLWGASGPHLCICSAHLEAPPPAGCQSKRRV